MMQKKIIKSGQGCRITSPWRTLVVRLPNKTNPTFRVSDVATEGIIGQPQLTFDSYDAAKNWLDNSSYDNRYFHVGYTRKDYTCYKIPLENGTDAWLPISVFPEEGSPKWKLLCQLFPDYFESEVEPRSFFESLAVDSFTNEQIDDIVRSSPSSDEVCERLFEGRNQEYIWKCCVEPYKKHNEKAADGAYMPQSRNCGVSTVFVDRNFTETPLTIVESYNLYVATRNKGVQGWFRDIVRQINFWEEHEPQNFVGAEIEPQPFFTESLINESFDPSHMSEEEAINKIESIVLDDSLSDDAKCEELWGQSYKNLVTMCGGFSSSKILSIFGIDSNISTQQKDDYNYAYRMFIAKPWSHNWDDASLSWYPYHNPLFVLGNETLKNAFNDWAHCGEEKRILQWWKKINHIKNSWTDAIHFLKEKWGLFEHEPEAFFTEEVVHRTYKVPSDVIKRFVLKFVKDNGYIKPFWNGQYSTPSPTVEEIHRTLKENPDTSSLDLCSESDIDGLDMYVSQVESEVNNPETPNLAVNEWKRDCIRVWKEIDSREVTKEDIKKIVGFVSSYIENLKYQERQRQKQEREREHERQVQSSSNTWAGQVGDEVTFTVAEANISTWIQPPSYYAEEYPLWKIKDLDGRVYSWGDTKNSGNNIEPNMTITGKIKKLNEFRGIKETQLWKVKISNEHEATPFFTESLLRESTDFSRMSREQAIQEITNICLDDSISDDEKCRKLWGKDHQRLCLLFDIVNDMDVYSQDFKSILPNNPNNHELTPGLLRLTVDELHRAKENHWNDSELNNSTVWWDALAPGDGYDGRDEDSLKDKFITWSGTESPYRHPNINPYQWWKQIKHVSDSQDELLSVIEHEPQAFFTENLKEELNISGKSTDDAVEEIKNIALDDHLSDDEKTKRLWGESFNFVRTIAQLFCEYMNDDLKIEYYRNRLSNASNHIFDFENDEFIENVIKYGQKVTEIRDSSLCRAYTPLYIGDMSWHSLESSFRLYSWPSEYPLGDYIKRRVIYWFNYVKGMIRCWKEVFGLLEIEPQPFFS